MAVLGFEGFDYQNSGSPLVLLVATTGWQQISGGALSTASGLLGGKALSGGNANTILRYTPPAGGNYGTLITGKRWLSSLTNTAGTIMQFVDQVGAVVHCGIAINASRQLFFWRGTTATVLGTGTTALVNNTWYYIEVKVKFGSGTSGQFEVRIEGQASPPEIVNNATNTINGANSFATSVDHFWFGGPLIQMDDFYLCDNSGATANDFLLGGTGLRVETTFPNTPDTPINFTALAPGYIAIGQGASNGTARANSIQLSPFTTTEGGSLTVVATRLGANMTGNITCAIYDAANLGGQPKNLIAASSTTLTNPLGNATFASAPDLNFAFSGVTLLPGVQYWIAFLCDNATATHYQPGNTVGVRYATTYPTFVNPLVAANIVTGENPFYLFLTYTGQNAKMVNETSFDSDTTYNYSITNGDIDLFSHGPLSNNPLIIHGVMVTAAYRKDDNTAQQFRTKLKSGATTVSGVTRNVITTYQGQSDMWLIDPNTGLAWTGTAVNNSKIGYEHL